MVTVAIDTRTRSGRADGPLVALQDNPLRLTGVTPPAGARVSLVTPDGALLAQTAVLTHEDAPDAPDAILSTATLPAWKATWGRRAAQAVQAFLQLHDGDDPNALVAAVPVALVANKAAALPPAPLPDYLTEAETREAIDDAVSAHADRRDNPHEVAAGQVSFAGQPAQVLNEAKDNWGTCWGFAFNLRSLSPDAWPVPGEAAARLQNIQLRASDNAKYFAEPKTIRLRLVDEDAGLDARSDNAVTVAEPLQWLNFHFSEPDPEGLRLPAAKAVATFVDEATGEATDLPIRVTTVGPQPEGCALLTDAQGTRRTDLFPHLNTLNFALEGPTVAAAIVALRDAVEAKQDALVAGENIAIEGNVISATGVDPTTSARIAALEQGRGIYKDPKTGKVSLYTPLPECPDGTLKVIMDLGFGTKVLPVEEEDSATVGCFDDGEHLFLFDGGGALSTAWGYKPPIYVYDTSLNRVCRKTGNLWFGGGEVLRFAKDWSGFIHIYGERFFFQGNDGRLYRMDMKNDTMPDKAIRNPGDSPIALWHNPLTGHLCHLSRTSAGVWHIRVYDDDLNAVTGEDGQQRIIDVTDVCVSAKLRGPTWDFTCQVGVKHIYGRAYVFSATSIGGAILQSQADDSLAILCEATVQEDPDNPGKVLCEKQANGKPVFDDYSINVLKRPITTPGPEIRFNTPVAAERNYADNAWHGMPKFFLQSFDRNWPSPGQHSCWQLTDGLDTWYLLSDGRAIRCDQFWETGAPGNVNNLPTYKAAPLKGVQDCLTNATPNAVVPLFMAGIGGRQWGYNDGIAMFASAAQFKDENGFSQNLALRIKANQTTYRNVTTDGLLPFWPRFNAGVINNACAGECWNAFVGCPVWYVNFDGIAKRSL